VTPSESTVTTPKEESAPNSTISSPDSVDPYFAPNEDDAILKIVAAHTPSHRGFWDKDGGKALNLVMGEQDNKRVSASRNLIDSESTSINDETGEYSHARTIPRLALTRSPGWTSYELPEDTARSLPVSIAPLLTSKNSTKSGRPSVPPDLHLPLESEPIEESAEEDADPPEGEGRGRERALQIIQARNQLPEPGMWRSLA